MLAILKEVKNVTDFKLDDTSKVNLKNAFIKSFDLIDGVIEYYDYRNKWFRTGDIGQFDNNGFLFITGRKKDMIIRNGFNIYPAELEFALKQIKGVMDCAVFGVADKGKGEKVIAYLMLSTETNSMEVKQVMKKLVSTTKIPNEFIEIASIPKNKNGKNDKLALRKIYCAI